MPGLWKYVRNVLLFVVACWCLTVPPMSTYVQNCILMPWVLPYNAIRTQDIVSGAQMSLIVTEACKLRLFDFLDHKRAGLLGRNAEYVSLTVKESLTVLARTGSLTSSCRTVRQIGESLTPTHVDSRKLRIIFRLLNSIAASGLVASAAVSRPVTNTDAFSCPQETGCYFNTNPALLFLTTFDSVMDENGEPVQNDASMCGMGVISNHISVLRQVSTIASSLTEHRGHLQIPQTKFVQDESVLDSDLWGTFATNSGSFQSRVASRVSTHLIRSMLNANSATIVDIGGGSGVFLTNFMAELQGRHISSVVGVLFDLPNVIHKFPSCSLELICQPGSIFEESDIKDLARTVRTRGSETVVLMFNSFLQHFDDALSVKIVETVIQSIAQRAADDVRLTEIVISIVELVTPGDISPTPYSSPSPLQFLELVWSDLFSPGCSWAGASGCFKSLWEYFALDSLTTMGRVFSTIISSLTSSSMVEGGEVRSAGFYFKLLQNLSSTAGDTLKCGVPEQNILFPLPASLTQVSCRIS
jgi:hypothetical protein